MSFMILTHIAHFGEPGDKSRGQEQTVGDEEKRDVGEVPGDVDDLGPGERLAARDHEKGDAELFRLNDTAPHPPAGELDLRHIQAILGHARISSTELYTHVSLEDLKEVVRRAHPHGRKS